MKAIMGVFCAIMLVGAINADAKKYAGIKGGVNMADLSADAEVVDNTSMRNGFSGGAFYGVDVNPQFGVRGEALYVMKGVKGDITTQDGDVHDGTISVDYIDIPLLFVANLATGDKIGLNLFAGPSFNFNIKSEVSTEDGVEDRKDGTKSFEFGAVIGGGLEYILSSCSIIADVRYSMGASSIVEDVEGQSIDVKNRGIGIMAGLKFGLGGE